MDHPFFIIIGSMKSGTSTLHRNLIKHPSVGMSKFKETNFFSQHFAKGRDWYESLFQEGHQVYGDTSPTYSKAHRYPATASNMYAVLPQAKLIYIVRDPIDRIISHLHHDLYRDRLHREEVDAAVLRNPDYIKTSSYYYQISHFTEFYARENVLVLSFEELRDGMNTTLNKICYFLGIDSYDFMQEQKVYNATENKYWIKSYDAVHKALPGPFIKPYHWLFYWLSVKIEKPVLKEETLKVIKEKLADDVSKFKALTGLPFVEWKKFNEV